MRRMMAMTHGAGAILAVWLAVATGFATPALAGGGLHDKGEAELIRTLIPSVVNITARSEVAAPGETEQASAVDPLSSYEIKVSAGSGFIIDPSGLIATNWHVVDGAFEILVTFSDGSHAAAETVGAARVVDLALLHVKTDHALPAVQWGDSTKVQVGDPVLAIGNALGVGMSVSAGIVSALNRNISDTPVDDFIQTDAAINHGNSGGPLFNLDGEVIGVNSAIISPTAASAGLGFAMPSNDANYVVGHLMRPGEYARPGWLGVKIQPVTLEMAEATGYAEPKGSIVAGVPPDGPAARAGLQIGDVILTFNGIAPTDDRSLLRMLTMSKPGSQAALGIWRDGEHLTVNATLDAWPQMFWERNSGLTHVASHRKIPADLGLSVAPMSDQLRAERHMTQDSRGVLITAVTPRTDAARRGVLEGDVIMRMGTQTVLSQQDLQAGIDKARGEGRRFGMFLLLRKNQPDTLTKYPGPEWITLQIANP